ncbi:hypothetical protein VME_45880 [Vibrio harveyi 1DA3]|nr:hypothetical protein VME_45880 [Vibrio harveyi 1DA3]
MKFNQDAAKKGGVSEYVLDGGAYVGNITAKHLIASTGTKGVEFTLTGDLKANYLTVWYEKADGEELSGFNVIQSIMGLLKLKGLTLGAHEQEIPELKNKPVGLVLQKVLTTKNDGSDGFKFEIKFPFSATSRKTYREALEGKPATGVDKYLETLKDKDQRKEPEQGGYGQPDLDDDLDNEIPF